MMTVWSLISMEMASSYCGCWLCCLCCLCAKWEWNVFVLLVAMSSAYCAAAHFFTLSFCCHFQDVRQSVFLVV